MLTIYKFINDDFLCDGGESRLYLTFILSTNIKQNIKGKVWTPNTHNKLSFCSISTLYDIKSVIKLNKRPQLVMLYILFANKRKTRTITIKINDMEKSQGIERHKKEYSWCSL